MTYDVTIYVLVDPRTRRVRYVGCTARSLKDRLYGHLASSTRALERWFRELAAHGLRPIIRAIGHADNVHDGCRIERAKIKSYRRRGEKLLNQGRANPIRVTLKSRVVFESDELVNAVRKLPC
jgi:hypothetical protein